MSAKEDFINFVQHHPSYYSIIKSPLFLDVLTHLTTGAKSSIQLHSHFSYIESSDLDEIIHVLEKVKLIKRVKGGSKLIFYASDDAQLLLDKYATAKDFLSSTYFFKLVFVKPGPANTIFLGFTSSTFLIIFSKYGFFFSFVSLNLFSLFSCQ